MDIQHPKKMIVLAEDIWWKEGVDATSLPLNVLFEVEECEDEFWDACEEALEKRYNVIPSGFKYTILEGTIQ